MGACTTAGSADGAAAGSAAGAASCTLPAPHGAQVCLHASLWGCSQGGSIMQLDRQAELAQIPFHCMPEGFTAPCEIHPCPKFATCGIQMG